MKSAGTRRSSPFRFRRSLTILPLLCGLMVARDARADVTMLANFAGAAPDNVYPPDPNAAAGPNHIVEYVNGGGLNIYTKSGMLLKALNDMMFWGANEIGDGHIVYDEGAQRWIYCELGNADGGQGINFAISDTNDPTGMWTERHFIPGFVDGTGFGSNADAYFFRTATGTLIVTKLSVLDANNSTYTTTPINGMQGGSPSLMPDAKPGDPYWSFDSGDSAGIHLDRIANALTTPLYTQLTVPVPGGAGSQTGPVSIRNNMMVTAGILGNRTIGGGVGGTGIQWDLLDLSGATPKLVQSGTIMPPAGTTVDYPNAALAPNGDIGIEYTLYDPGGKTMSIYVTGRAATDPPNTLATPVQVKSGNYLMARTGDYTSVRADILSTGTAGNTLWGCNMTFGGTGPFTWQTSVWQFSLSGGGGADGGGGTSSGGADAGGGSDATLPDAGAVETGGSTSSGSTSGSSSGTSGSSSGTGGTSSSTGSSSGSTSGSGSSSGSSGTGTSASGSGSSSGTSASSSGTSSSGSSGSTSTSGSGSSGTGSSGASGSTGSGGPDAGTGSSSSGAGQGTPGSSSSGCGCVVGASPPQGWLFGGAVMGVAAVCAARRRRAATGR